jgi:hypothetical protein
VATELALIAAFVYLPPLQAVIGTAAFPAWLWLPLLAPGPALLLVDDRVRRTVASHRKEGRS